MGKVAPWSLCAALCAAALALAAPSPDAAAATLPPGFSDSVVLSGLVQPTQVQFAADGRVFVAQKDGQIFAFDDLSDTTPTRFADLRTEVLDYWDRGLLGLALAPGFPAAPYVYALFTYDAALGAAAPRWNDACPTPPGPTTDGCVASARLVRFEASGNLAAGPPALMLWDWCAQFPSHTIGSLGFGADGALYVSGGDGASFSTLDYGQFGNPVNPCGDPPTSGTPAPPGAEGGQLRSQDLRTMSDPAGLDGSILRIGPASGDGLLGNPLFMSADSNARRIVAQGLRNPFRFTFRPGTSDLWIGDVGSGSWEEIDRLANPAASPYANFGWPCYEGAGRRPSFDGLNLAICENLYTDTAANVRAPYFTYAHTAHVVAGESCPTGSSSISGMVFYAGGPYPAAYDGALFFADYSRRCIWAMQTGANGLPDPAKVLTFAAAAANPVDLQVGPGGDLFYVDIGGGTIHRVTYTNGNRPPAARATATPSSGIAPLTVQLDGRGSTDADGDPLAYSWDLDGNGTFGDSTLPAPSFTYTERRVYLAALRVTDSHGASATATVRIDASNTAPTVTIDAPLATRKWAVGDRIAFRAHANDPEDGALAAARFSWTLRMHHCQTTCHIHVIQTWDGIAAGSFTAPDHEYPSYLELSVTATDSGGLQSTRSVRLDPRTVLLRFTTGPVNLRLIVNGRAATAPFSRRVIANSANTVSAPSPQTKGGTWRFASWSDGGAQTHTVVAAVSRTLNAAFRR